jgi:hypothetical protein
MNVAITVSSNTGLPGSSTSSLTFNGLFDGVSVSNSVGSLNYSLVLKGNAQPLTEVHTLIPGLRTMGVNPYRTNPLEDLIGSGSDNIGSLAEAVGVTGVNPAVSYKAILLAALLRQQSPADYLTPSTDSAIVGMQDVWNSGKYQEVISSVISLLQSGLDITSLQGGAIDQMDASTSGMMKYIYDTFLQSNETVWDNMVHFFSQLGACLVCANNKIFAVPQNGFIQSSSSSPSSSDITGGGASLLGSAKAGSVGGINTAHTDTYFNFSYNDVGFKSLDRVVIMASPNTNYHTEGYLAYAVIGVYPSAKGQTSNLPAVSAGTLILSQHPFMYIKSDDNNDSPTYQQQQQTQQNKTSNTGASPVALTDAISTSKQNTTTVIKEVKSVTSDFQTTGIFNNYAETKFYQYKYQDRAGSVSMEFNPNWVPGTTGVLYMPGFSNGSDNVPSLSLQFFVTSVSHRISVSPPNTGQAITTINFNCGLVGSPPAGIQSDTWFGYTSGKMRAIQQAFLDDINS